ncbi:mitochondrial, Calcium uptake protein 3 [Lucilia cuprina]|nr:mitochondrial, Calcium uptake protein 3 [Lucilia cuprina]
MATNVCSRLFVTRNLVNLTKNLRPVQRNYNNYRFNAENRKNYVKYLLIVGGGVTAFVCANLVKTKTNTVQAFNIKRIKRDELSSSVKLTARERRFIKFSSVEYDGQLYMTPQDFLDSVVEQEPRPRLKRRILTDQEVTKIKDETPPLKKGSNQLFRTLRDKGIISYTEYLFLLSILTKPKSGFRIAFNMFDTDGNQRVDKNEFLVILKILGGSFRSHELDEETRRIRLWGDKEVVAFTNLTVADMTNGNSELQVSQKVDLREVFTGLAPTDAAKREEFLKKDARQERLVAFVVTIALGYIREKRTAKRCGTPEDNICQESIVIKF